MDTRSGNLSVIKTTQKYDEAALGKGGIDVELVRLTDYICLKEEPEYLPTGFDKLDDRLGGLDGGDLLVVASDSARLNSTFAVSLVQKTCVIKGTPVMYFSPGCRASFFFHELLVNCARLTSSPRRGCKGKEIDALNEAMPAIAKSYLYVHDSPDLPLGNLTAMIMGTSSTYGVRLVVINNLDFIRTDERAGFMTDETEDIIRGLKMTARAANIPIVLLANVPDMTGKEPRMPLVDPYGIIGRYADVVLFLQDMDSVRAGEVDVTIARSRSGSSGVIRLCHIARQYRLENLSISEDSKGKRQR